MPYNPAIHGAYVDAYDHHKQQNPQQSNDWIDKLKREFYDRGNSVGTSALYAAIQKRHPAANAYPTKRFVRAWLRRQATVQVHQRPHRKKTDIQAIITSKPNELIQVDYMYFYRHLTGEPLYAEDEMDEEEKRKFDAQQDKLKKKGVLWPGCINAVDAFSKKGYSVPIKGNINSQKAWTAMKKIIALAKRNYPNQPIKKIQTDKGSEFMLNFRRGLKGLNDQNAGEYKHVFGFEGRSQSQGLVERYNGTIKMMLRRRLAGRLGLEWKDSLDEAVKNYNSNKHSTIKMAPDDVNPGNYSQVKENILTRAKTNRRFQGIVYAVGDFVRIKIFKPKRLRPNWTYKRGPLYEMTDEDNDYAGIYMISKVNGGGGKLHKAPTYSVVARWSKEATPDIYLGEAGGTLPSGQDRLRGAERDVNVPGQGQMRWPKGSFMRKFTKDELLRVPKDDKDKPIAQKKKELKLDQLDEDTDTDTEDEEEEEAAAKPQAKPAVAAAAKPKRKRKQVQKLDPSNVIHKKRVKEYEVEKVIDDRIRKGKQEFLVKWKGYPSEENTWEPYNNLKDNQQFKNYQKKMKKKK